MSRLDSAIRRLEAQRACLDFAVAEIADLDGPVLEFGLGNGRTFDHLRARLPSREIFVFDRRIAAHPDCIPDEAHMILGDVLETAPAAGARIGGRAALAHCDIGTGDKGANSALAATLAPLIDRLMAPNALVVGDQPMSVDGWQELPPPSGVQAGRYHIYRVKSRRHP